AARLTGQDGGVVPQKKRHRGLCISRGSHPDRAGARRWTLSGDALDARDGLTSGCNSTGGKTPTMMRTVAHFLPFAALAGGVLILLMPRLLNYVVAVYLILVGAIG